MNPDAVRAHFRLIRSAYEAVNEAIKASQKGDVVEFRRQLSRANLHGVEALAISNELSAQAKSEPKIKSEPKNPS
jgi:hypothetical protein